MCDAVLCEYQLVQPLGCFVHQTLHMMDVESVNLVVQDGRDWTFSMNGENFSFKIGLTSNVSDPTWMELLKFAA